MITLCARQISCGTSDPTVVQFLQDFMDVIAPLLELDGSKWNILGVLGLSSKYKPPPRSKFLALALTFYIQRCLVEGPKIRLKRYINMRFSTLRFRHGFILVFVLK